LSQNLSLIVPFFVAKYRLTSDRYTTSNDFDLSVTGAAGIVEVYIQGAWLRPCVSSLNEANVVCQYFGMTNALQVSRSSTSIIIPPTVFELDCSDDSVNCVPSTQSWFPSFDVSSQCSNNVNYSVTCQSKHSTLYVYVYARYIVFWIQKVKKAIWICETKC